MPGAPECKTVSLRLDSSLRVTYYDGDDAARCLGAALLSLVHPSDRTRVLHFVRTVQTQRRILTCDFVTIDLRNEYENWFLRGVPAEGRASLLSATRCDRAVLPSGAPPHRYTPTGSDAGGRAVVPLPRDFEARDRRPAPPRVIDSARAARTADCFEGHDENERFSP